MTTQSTYSERMPKATPGLIAGSDYNTATGVNEDAVALAFGVPVHQGVEDNGVKKAGVLANFRGVTVRDITLGAEKDAYPQYANVGLLNRGQIWVRPSVAVTPTDPVHYNGTTGDWLITGQQGPIVGAKWRTSAGPGEDALLELT